MAFDPFANPPAMVSPDQFAGPDTGGVIPGQPNPIDILVQVRDLMSLYLQVETDDSDLAEAQAIALKVQSRLAKEQQQTEKMMGVSPENKRAARIQTRGY